MKIYKLKLVICLVLQIFTTMNFASDHTESPQVIIDPSADLNDLYAFVNPNDSDELILIATVLPFANSGAQFSDAVEYNFKISNSTLPNDFSSISCTFEDINKFKCRLPNNETLIGNINEVTESANFRVFAGLRDDPFFFDFGAFTQTVATLQPQFTDPGVDTFLGLDTLAIVIGVKSNVLTNNGNDPILNIYATTNRISGATLNGSTTGSFYNVDQSGHGFLIEVLPNNRMLATWYVFDNDGNPLWLFGSGDIDGLVAHIPLQRLNGAMFPPNFNPDDVNRIEAGQLTFDFNNCNNVKVTFDSADEFELGTTSFDVTRLTSIQGLPCQMLKNGQVDRAGRPAINTALINLLEKNGLKDIYNSSDDPNQWSALFQSEMAANLAALDTLDGTVGNVPLNPATLASVLVNDYLIINTSVPNCDAYLAVEFGITDQCGGRTLSRDVMDDTLGAVVGPGVTDGVSDDNDFLSDFPFIGLPSGQ